MLEKQLKKYIIPNVLAMVGTSCYVLADTFFISVAEGANGITALNLVLPVYGILFAIGSMIGVGSATRYTLEKAMGRKDADAYFSNAILWTVLMSLLFIAAGIFWPENILRLLGADDAIVKLGSTYLQIVLCFTPFFMLNYTFTAFVRNDGAPNIAMAATLGSGIFNILFDYIFMFPLQMGITGAALATAISPIVSMGICCIHYLSPKNTIQFRKMRPSGKKLISACILGVVAFVGEISSGMTTLVFNFILLDLAGNTGVAAYGVIANLALVGTALFNGVSQGMQPLASRVHGKADREGENKIYKHSLQIAVGIAIVLVLVVLLFGDSFVRIFNQENSDALASYAEQGLRIYFLGFLVASFNIVRAGFYSATGRGKESSILSLSRGIIGIVVFAYLLSRIWGVTGVWLAFPAAEVFTWFLGTVCMRKKPVGEPQEG